LGGKDLELQVISILEQNQVMQNVEVTRNLNLQIIDLQNDMDKAKLMIDKQEKGCIQMQ